MGIALSKKIKRWKNQNPSISCGIHQSCFTNCHQRGQARSGQLLCIKASGQFHYYPRQSHMLHPVPCPNGKLPLVGSPILKVNLVSEVKPLAGEVHAPRGNRIIIKHLLYLPFKNRSGLVPTVAITQTFSQLLHSH